MKVGDKMDPNRDVLHVDDERIYIQKNQQMYYLALYKPRGYVTTALSIIHILPGHPVSFRTTDIFLRCFGLSSLADLPPVRGDQEGEAAT